MQETIITVSAGTIGLLLAVVGYLLKKRDDDYQKSVSDIYGAENKIEQRIERNEAVIWEEIGLMKEQIRGETERMHKIETNYISKFKEVNANLKAVETKIDSLMVDIKKEIRIILLEGYTQKSECSLHIKEVKETIGKEVKDAIFKEMIR